MLLRKVRVRRRALDADGDDAAEVEDSMIIAACRRFVPATSGIDSDAIVGTADIGGKGTAARGASGVAARTVVAGKVKEDAPGPMMVSFGLTFDSCKRRALF